MTITITIDDSYLPCIEAHLATQVTAYVDATTKKPVTTPHYQDAEDFITSMITDLMNGLAQQYPTPAMQTKLSQIQALKKQLAPQVSAQRSTPKIG